jgi:amicyanin
MPKSTPAPAPQTSKTPLIIGIIVAVVIIGGGITLAATHKSSSTTMTMTSPAATTDVSTAVATNAVKVASYAFSPAVITVKAGTMVTWTNSDAVSHTVTSDTGTMLKSDLFARGQSYSYTFTTAGTYSYHCVPHPYMKGTVVVTN